MKTQALLLSLFLPLSSLVSTPALAASEDECAIWLCAPSGFPEGCDKAKAAMKMRIKQDKPPLPPYAACAIEDEEDAPIKSEETSVIHIREHQRCVAWQRISTKNREERHCTKYETIPEQIVPGNSCYYGRSSTTRIEGCTGVYKKLSVVDTATNTPIGKPLYYQHNFGHVSFLLQK